MYYLLENSPYLDEYIDYFLDGIKYYSGRFSHGDEDPRLGNEFWHLENGLKKATKLESVIKIIDYFKGKPETLHIIGFNEVMPVIMMNCSKLYNDYNEIFEKIFDLYLLLHKKYFYAEANHCVKFFDDTDTRIKTFEKILELRDKIEAYGIFKYLQQIINKSCFPIIFEKYRNNNFTDKDIWVLHNFIDGELYYEFNTAINNETNNKFILKPPRDFKKEQENKLKRDIYLLFNKKAFIQEVYSIYQNEKIDKLDNSLLSEFRYKIHGEESIYSNLVLKEIGYLIEKEAKSLEQIEELVEKTDWEYFSARQIYVMLQNHTTLELNQSQLKSLEKWCIENVNKIDFKTAIIQHGDTTTTSELAVILNYFLRKYNFKYSHNTLLDMLSYDWMGIGIDYLSDYLSIGEMTERILHNLTKNEKNDYELKNYFTFCKKHKIKAARMFAVDEILNSTRNIDIRRQALDLLKELNISAISLYKLFVQMNDNFKWELVEILIQRKNTNIHTWLMDAFKQADDKEKLRICSYLIEFGDLHGLEYYTELIEKCKRFLPEVYEKKRLASLRNPKAIPYLLRLLKLSYDKDMVENKYETLYHVTEVIFTNIAMVNENNFKNVYKAISGFIKENGHLNEKINFLYLYLNRLERQLYFSKSQNFTLEQALNKMKEIKIW